VGIAVNEILQLPFGLQMSVPDLLMWVGGIIFLVSFVAHVVQRSADKKPATGHEKETQKEKDGKAFEDYVESLLERESGKVRVLRTTKYGFPDIEASITHNGKEHEFSVECKYRSRFDRFYRFRSGDVVERDYIKKCQEHQEKYKGRPFFLVLGVGTPPSNPQYLYSIPLKDLPGAKLSHDKLEPYLQERGKVEPKYSPDKLTLCR